MERKRLTAKTGPTKTMTIDEQIAVMQAFRDGAEIEVRRKGSEKWCKADRSVWNWSAFDYRIATKKEMTLVEELRSITYATNNLNNRAADRIEFLESHAKNWIALGTTDELLAEIARRIGK